MRLASSLALASLALLASSAVVHGQESGQSTGSVPPSATVDIYALHIEAPLAECHEVTEALRQSFQGEVRDLLQRVKESRRGAKITVTWRASYTVEMDAAIHTTILLKDDTIKLDMKPTLLQDRNVELQVGLEIVQRKTNSTLMSRRSSVSFDPGSACVLSAWGDDTFFVKEDGTQSERHPHGDVILAYGAKL